jgi:rhodanese-related sulfurtransferase
MMGRQMKDLTDILKNCTLEFFGSSKHKVLPPDLAELPNVLLLDVRSREEFESLAIPMGIHSNIQFMHIPIDVIPNRVDEIPSEKNIVVFCPSNFRSTLAYAYLKTLGHESVRILSGGYHGLTDALMPGKVYKHVAGQNKER